MAGTACLQYLEQCRGYDLVFQRGTWPVLPVTPDWTAYGEVLGVDDTDQYAPTATVITVPLPGLIGQSRPPEVKLTLRGDELTEFPVGALNWRMVHIALQWPWERLARSTGVEAAPIIVEPTREAAVPHSLRHLEPDGFERGEDEYVRTGDWERVERHAEAYLLREVFELDGDRLTDVAALDQKRCRLLAQSGGGRWLGQV